MKCENCNQEGFDALLTLAGSGALHADGWCLDCIKKWSYAHKNIKIDKPKIEYYCVMCHKQLFPQNGVTYVYFDAHAPKKFYCRDHGEPLSEDTYSTVTRYTRQMHLEALERLEEEEEEEKENGKK